MNIFLIIISIIVVFILLGIQTGISNIQNILHDINFDLEKLKNRFDPDETEDN